MRRSWLKAALSGTFLLFFSCISAPTAVAPPKPRYFSNLNYDGTAARYRQISEEKFKRKDHSYVLSLLSYGITSLYGLNLGEARRAFWAAYKVDAGERPEAAKLYDWLVVDSRAVYKLKKRERELVHFYLGLCYLFENNLEEALVEFKKLRQFDQEASKLPIVNFYTGLVYEKLEKFDDALIEYRHLETLGMKELIRNVERLRDSGYLASEDSVELVVQVDHQTVGSVGRTEVYVDSFQLVKHLPEVCDSFAVRLSPAEANRKAAQEASAKLARYGLRLLSAAVLGKTLPGYGEELAEDIADITLGKEEENRDRRAWGYAPLNFSFARLRIPGSTRVVRLVFFNRAGEMLGYCDYPLYGENARAVNAAGMFFIVVGLAEEFYLY
ncbi:MAG: tetratricopeptide repeat protein [bacterium]